MSVMCADSAYRKSGSPLSSTEYSSLNINRSKNKEDDKPGTSPFILEQCRNLQKYQLKSSLSSKLSARPGSLELIEKGVLQVDPGVDSLIRTGSIQYPRVEAVSALEAQDCVPQLIPTPPPLSSVKPTSSQIASVGTKSKYGVNSRFSHPTTKTMKDETVICKLGSLVFHNYCPKVQQTPQCLDPATSFHQKQIAREVQQAEMLRLQDTARFHRMLGKELTNLAVSKTSDPLENELIGQSEASKPEEVVPVHFPIPYASSVAHDDQIEANESLKDTQFYNFDIRSQLSATEISSEFSEKTLNFNDPDSISIHHVSPHRELIHGTINAERIQRANSPFTCIPNIALGSSLVLSIPSVSNTLDPQMLPSGNTPLTPNQMTSEKLCICSSGPYAIPLVNSKTIITPQSTTSLNAIRLRHSNSAPYMCDFPKSDTGMEKNALMRFDRIVVGSETPINLETSNFQTVIVSRNPESLIDTQFPLPQTNQSSPAIPYTHTFLDTKQTTTFSGSSMIAVPSTSINTTVDNASRPCNSWVFSPSQNFQYEHSSALNCSNRSVPSLSPHLSQKFYLAASTTPDDPQSSLPSYDSGLGSLRNSSPVATPIAESPSLKQIQDVWLRIRHLRRLMSQSTTKMSSPKEEVGTLRPHAISDAMEELKKENDRLTVLCRLLVIDRLDSLEEAVNPVIDSCSSDSLCIPGIDSISQLQAERSLLNSYLRKLGGSVLVDSLTPNNNIHRRSSSPILHTMDAESVNNDPIPQRPCTDNKNPALRKLGVNYPPNSPVYDTVSSSAQTQSFAQKSQWTSSWSDGLQKLQNFNTLSKLTSHVATYPDAIDQPSEPPSSPMTTDALFEFWIKELQDCSHDEEMPLVPGVTANTTGIYQSEHDGLPHVHADFESALSHNFVGQDIEVDHSDMCPTTKAAVGPQEVSKLGNVVCSISTTRAESISLCGTTCRAQNTHLFNYSESHSDMCCHNSSVRTPHSFCVPPGTTSYSDKLHINLVPSPNLCDIDEIMNTDEAPQLFNSV